MPRGFRTRKPKEPRVPLTYEESDVVRDVAGRLIRLFPAAFGWTTNFKLGYLLVHGSRRGSDRRLDAMAKFRKVPPVYHGITGYDAVVEVHEWAWNELTAEQQEAIVSHELCHGEMTEKGTLRIVRHDLEEFAWVVRQYGAWAADIRRFDEQLALFDAAGPAFRTPKTDQATLDDVRPKGEINVEALRGEVDRAILPEPVSLRNRRIPPAAPLS